MTKLWISLLVPLVFLVDNVFADVQFRCPNQLATLQPQASGYLRELDIPAGQVLLTVDTENGVMTLALNTLQEDTRTLDFFTRLAFDIKPEHVRLPTSKKTTRVVSTVSKKEIMLSLLQHGRTTVFMNDDCSLEALTNHVGVRQNIVAWAEHVDWVWPNGRSAKWNSKYWRRGTPKPTVAIQDAVMDTFLQQRKYSIGCYTATKLVIVQGILDYYQRIKPDPERTRHVEAILLEDGDPLVGIEPGKMWSFEPDFDPRDMEKPGKLIELHANVAPDNFVPGDWVYLLNTDAKSYGKTGYEGSNALYLGNNRFDDYFNDHGHSYTYEEKLDEVYQWRNGVFSRSRDARKIKQLKDAELRRLSSTPAAGGIQLDIRGVPRYF